MDPQCHSLQESRPPHGQYVNYFEVGYNAFEFLLDFGRSIPGRENTECQTRLVLSPITLKALSTTILTSMKEYQRQFGPIPADSQGETEACE